MKYQNTDIQADDDDLIGITDSDRFDNDLIDGRGRFASLATSTATTENSVHVRLTTIADLGLPTNDETVAERANQRLAPTEGYHHVGVIEAGTTPSASTMA